MDHCHGNGVEAARSAVECSLLATSALGQSAATCPSCPAGTTALLLAYALSFGQQQH